MRDKIHRFSDGSADYAAFRPSYTDVFIGHLAQRIAGCRTDASSLVIDAGSGTGIFTRQLSDALPDDMRMIGVEPSESMREQAIATGGIGNRIGYVDGRAEKLPFDNASIRAVCAATAAHWFDRTAFYAEASRVLVPKGLLIIAEYVRATDVSLAACIVEQFLEEFGEARTYLRPDYQAELIQLYDFGVVEHSSELTWFDLSPQQFAGLTLSSSHAKPALQKLGWEKAFAIITARVSDLMTPDGFIPYGYRFEGFATEKY